MLKLIILFLLSNIFFYINYLIQNDRYQDAKTITDYLDYLNSPLHISQTKKWIEENKFDEKINIKDLMQFNA